MFGYSVEMFINILEIFFFGVKFTKNIWKFFKGSSDTAITKSVLKGLDLNIITRKTYVNIRVSFE